VAENFVSVDTLFHLPEVYLFLTLVDLLEGRAPDTRGARFGRY
jgi:hypothetical protein